MHNGNLSTMYCILRVAEVKCVVEAAEIPPIPGQDQCMLLFTLQLPAAREDVDHCIISIPSANITANKKSTFLSLIPQCVPDMNISVQSVDRCGHKGPKSAIKPSVLTNEIVATRVPPQHCVDCTNKCEFVGLCDCIIDTIFNVSQSVFMANIY